MECAITTTLSFWFLNRDIENLDGQCLGLICLVRITVLSFRVVNRCEHCVSMQAPRKFVDHSLQPNISLSDDRIHVDPGKFRKYCSCKLMVICICAPWKRVRYRIRWTIALRDGTRQIRRCLQSVRRFKSQARAGCIAFPASCTLGLVVGSGLPA